MEMMTAMMNEEELKQREREREREEKEKELESESELEPESELESEPENIIFTDAYENLLRERAQKTNFFIKLAVIFFIISILMIPCLYAAFYGTTLVKIIAAMGIIQILWLTKRMVDLLL